MTGEVLEEQLRSGLPHLPEEAVAALARAIDRIVSALAPARIYLFGSHARGDVTDLLVVVPSSDQPSYRMAQAAYHAVGSHVTPMDILVMPQEEFEWRSRSPASLPSTVLREGKILYAA